MIRELDSLFHQQLESWRALRKGVEALARAKTRAVRVDGFEVLLRHIPHRMASTTAAVDHASVSRRRCFLCAENLDPEEEGLPLGTNFTVYCNPFPIVDRHLTIVHRQHRPQRLAGQVAELLDIARALTGTFIVYNGPECGASAPDHLHFQAGSRALPIETDGAEVAGPTIPGYVRHVVVFKGVDRFDLVDRVDRVLALLSSLTGRSPEPMINIAAWYDPGTGWTLNLFPRGKHRPRAFETGELIASPAAIDLCGVFVLPREEDFERVSGAEIAAVYREVTLPDDLFEQLLTEMEGAW